MATNLQVVSRQETKSDRQDSVERKLAQLHLEIDMLLEHLHRQIQTRSPK
ncbi:MAG: hypothetical protein RMK91_03090 [Pseudanabaenaceae cyanobacterium SKYGB_i_bin29]|nr:hypothetical protein [Pseudanabaenaceae cyanobacterium SKYG29]MDW8420828.1 hypothetical protein [Pseudanabaenaceae cyanobacterium SKYGB_i_bin29]